MTSLTLAITLSVVRESIRDTEQSILSMLEEAVNLATAGNFAAAAETAQCIATAGKLLAHLKNQEAALR